MQFSLAVASVSVSSEHHPSPTTPPNSISLIHLTLYFSQLIFMHIGWKI